MCVRERECVCVCVRARARVCERETESQCGDSERASVGRQRDCVGDKETTRVSERPIAVKKSLRRRERRV